uniref:ML-like domain-containing protein n=1 Tax=Bionectria ochroleuca TaxID=29856 RepID=A0A8H7NB83_BIOOC
MKGLSLIALASAVMVAVGATKTTLSSVESTTSTDSACSLVTSTEYRINTVLENPTKWLASINRKYYRGQHSWSDSIPIFTATVEHAGSIVPAIGYVASGILEIEGYKVTSSVVTATACGTTQPSPDPDSICHLSNNDGLQETARETEPIREDMSVSPTMITGTVPWALIHHPTILAVQVASLPRTTGTRPASLQ